MHMYYNVAAMFAVEMLQYFFACQLRTLLKDSVGLVNTL